MSETTMSTKFLTDLTKILQRVADPNDPLDHFTLGPVSARDLLQEIYEAERIRREVANTANNINAFTKPNLRARLIGILQRGN